MPAQTRHTLEASGRMAAASAVYCPYSARCVDLADCKACPHAHSVGPKSVACTHPAIKVDARDLREPDRLRVGHIMTNDVFCVRADVAMDRVIEQMASRGFSGVPVVDERGHPVGVVSRADVIRHCAQRGDEKSDLVAGDLMSKHAICVDVSTSLSLASAIMAYYRIHRVPVIDQDGKVVGMLAAIDVLRWLGAADGYLYGRDHTAR